MAKGRIGELTCKLPTLKEELEAGLLRISGEVSNKILPTYSTLHLLFCNGRLILELMITNGNVETKKVEPFLAGLIAIRDI